MTKKCPVKIKQIPLPNARNRNDNGLKEQEVGGNILAAKSSKYPPNFP